MRKRDWSRCMNPQGKPDKVISRWCPKEREGEKEGERDNDCPDQKKYRRKRVRPAGLARADIITRLRSATYVQRHLHDDDDDKDDEDYHFSTAARSLEPRYFKNASYFGRSYKEIAVSLPITRKVARNLTLLILGGPLLIRERRAEYKKTSAQKVMKNCNWKLRCNVT